MAVEIVSCCLLTVLTNFNMTLSCFNPDNQDVKLNPMYLTYRYIFLSCYRFKLLLVCLASDCRVPAESQVYIKSAR
jgi:hypothetical protein